MKFKVFITVLFFFSLQAFEVLFAKDPIFIEKIPSRIKLFETINFNFQVDQNIVEEYRYRLRVPGDWMGGIKYLSDSWSDWEKGKGRNISFNNFNVEGNYKFEIEYKEYNSKRTKKIVSKFKAYWEYPEVRTQSFNIDKKVFEIKDKKQRYKALADEFYEAYKIWDRKYQYEFNKLKLTTSPDDILNKIGATLTNEGVDKLVENLAGKAATKWLNNLFAPKKLYDIVKEGSLTLVLIMRNRQVNEAAFMTVLTNRLYQVCSKKAY